MRNFNNYSEAPLSVEKNTNASIGIDWISFTFFMKDGEEEKYFNQYDAFRATHPVFEFMFDDMFLFERNSSHYQLAYGFHENCAFFYDDSTIVKGFNVSIPGHAIEWFLYSCDMDIIELFKYFSDNDIRLSRLDICLDDFSKKYRPSWYHDKLLNFEIKTRMKFSSFYSNNRGTGGTTFTLGKRNTEKYLRIYDKDVESKGEIDSVRYEIEIHRRVADRYMKYILQYGIAKCFSSLFGEFLQILSRPIPSFAGVHLKETDYDADFRKWIETLVSRIDKPKPIHYQVVDRLYRKRQYVLSCQHAIALLYHMGRLNLDEYVQQIKNWSLSSEDLRYISAHSNVGNWVALSDCDVFEKDVNRQMDLFSDAHDFNIGDILVD